MTVDLTRIVRPLVWEKLSSDCFVAETQFGSAAVQNESHALSLNRWGWWMVGSGEDDSPNGYKAGITAAQAAANADHAARVLAALDAELLGELVKAANGVRALDADDNEAIVRLLDLRRLRAILAKLVVTP